MSNDYQAVYDVVRSRISGGNISDAVRDVLYNAFDISHVKAVVQQDLSAAAFEMQRPSVLYRPEISRDGSKWCALYGVDLHSGLAGFGATVEEAMRDFDQAWLKERTSALARSAP